MSPLAGLPALVRHAVRRDRIMVAAWTCALAVVAYASVDATRRLYPTTASRIVFAAGAGANKATIAVYGPSTDLSTLGGLATWKLNALGAVLVSVMSMVIVVRHTRGDEDAGRLELIGAGVVGRSAPLAAALVTAIAASLGVGLLTAAGLAMSGLAGEDSLAFGLGLAAAGAVFAATTAVAAWAARAPPLGRGPACWAPRTCCGRSATPPRRAVRWPPCRGFPPSAGPSMSGRSVPATGGFSPSRLPLPRRGAPPRSPCCGGATWGPGWRRPGAGGQRPALACEVRSAWHGVCSAAR